MDSKEEKKRGINDHPVGDESITAHPSSKLVRYQAIIARGGARKLKKNAPFALDDESVGWLVLVGAWHASGCILIVVYVYVQLNGDV